MNLIYTVDSKQMFLKHFFSSGITRAASTSGSHWITVGHFRPRLTSGTASTRSCWLTNESPTWPSFSTSATLTSLTSRLHTPLEWVVVFDDDDVVDGVVDVDVAVLVPVDRWWFGNDMGWISSTFYVQVSHPWSP